MYPVGVEEKQEAKSSVVRRVVQRSQYEEMKDFRWASVRPADFFMRMYERAYGLQDWQKGCKAVTREGADCPFAGQNSITFGPLEKPCFNYCMMRVETWLPTVLGIHCLESVKRIQTAEGVRTLALGVAFIASDGTANYLVAVDPPIEKEDPWLLTTVDRVLSPKEKASLEYRYDAKSPGVIDRVVGDTVKALTYRERLVENGAVWNMILRIKDRTGDNKILQKTLDQYPEIVQAYQWYLNDAPSKHVSKTLIALEYMEK